MTSSKGMVAIPRNLWHFPVRTILVPYLKKCDLIIEDEKTENDVANTISCAY